MIETRGLGAGSYPTPIEKDETNIDIKIHLTIETTDIFPESWDKKEIEEYIKGNVREYLSDGDIEIHEIEV